MLQVVIDTNVGLSFFHFTDEDLDKLDQLAVLARRGMLELLLPKQVIDEYTSSHQRPAPSTNFCRPPLPPTRWSLPA